MIRKTMKIGEVRTSVKLESEFWDYLKAVATQRHLRTPAFVNQVAAASPKRTNLASTLRTYALVHARLQTEAMQREMDNGVLAGNTQDLARVLEACPLPALTMDGERAIRKFNRAFSLWLNLDGKATIGQRLDNVMILRAPGMRGMWSSLLDGQMPQAGFNATYVSPGKAKTAQAIAVALSAPSTEPDKHDCVVMFETLTGSS